MNLPYPLSINLFLNNIPYLKKRLFQVINNFETCIKHVIINDREDILPESANGVVVEKKWCEDMVCVSFSENYTEFKFTNDVFVYSMTNTYGNLYVFTDEMKFSFPTMPALLKKKFPKFMKNLWTLKKIIFCSAKSVEDYILNEETESENVVGSGLSSPYVSPNKRKETKC